MWNRIRNFVFFLWLRSLRIRGPSLPKNCKLFSSWHCDLPAAIAVLRRQKPLAMVSSSKEGKTLASFLRSLDWPVVFGSSNRQQHAVRHLLRHITKGESAAMALDGPRGPVGIEKPGVRWLIEKSETSAILLKLRYSAVIRLRTWDQMRLPLPFSVVECEWCYL